MVCHPSSAPLNTSPLLHLPNELKLAIFFYLPNEHSVALHSNTALEPHLMILRRTHPSFRRLLHHRPFESQSWYHRGDLLFEAEKSFAYLFADNTYPCYGCPSVLPVVRFSCMQTMLEKDLGGSEAGGRCCKGCVRNGTRVYGGKEKKLLETGN